MLIGDLPLGTKTAIMSELECRDRKCVHVPYQLVETKSFLRRFLNRKSLLLCRSSYAGVIFPFRKGGIHKQKKTLSVSCATRISAPLLESSKLYAPKFQQSSVSILQCHSDSIRTFIISQLSCIVIVMNGDHCLRS